MSILLTVFTAFSLSDSVSGTPKKKFVLVVRVPEAYDKAKAEAVYPQWEQAIAYWKAEEAYVESFAFPVPGTVLSGKDRTPKPGMVTQGGQKVVSIVILLAENLDRATELAKHCPVLDHGGTVEIRERPE